MGFTFFHEHLPALNSKDIKAWDLLAPLWIEEAHNRAQVVSLTPQQEAEIHDIYGN